MEDYTPGHTITNFEELSDYFKRMDTIDKNYENKRREIAKKLHKFQDGNSCERVCDAIWGKV